MRQFTFKSGFITDRTAQQLNEIQRWIERFESHRRGDSELATVERIRVKLTAQNGATPPVYSGVEQGFGITGFPETEPIRREFSPTTMPIYERNGRTVSAAALAAGYHCWIDRRTLVDGKPYYEFDIGESGADLIDISGRTGSVADVTAAQFLRTVVSGTAGATVVTPDNASTLLPGDVSTGAQDIAGVKTFWGAGVGTSNANVIVRDNQIVILNNSAFASVSGVRIYSSNPPAESGGYVEYAFAGGTLQHTLNDGTDTVITQHSIGGSGEGKFRLVQAAAGTQSIFQIDDSTGATADGFTGTGGGGDTFVGGLFTAAGSGPSSVPWANITGGDEGAQDAVGGILVDSTRINFTYDDVTPSITADLIANTITAGYLSASATDILFGRSTAGAGAGEEIPCTAAGRALLDDATAAAQATTLGLGTADSPQFAGINLGHASDTTLTRTGAGDAAIEGNAIYRAGGTDVPIADGGTGRSSHTAYAVLCGGIDATSAQQSIAGVGTAAQVLTSNGAGALPTFQDANVADGDKGDITVASGAWTIDAGVISTTKLADNAVTFAKMQTLSASVLLGNDAIGTAVQEISLGTGLDFGTGELSVDVTEFAASQANQEAASSDLVVVTPLVQQYHPSAAKSWAQWDASSGTPTNQASYNVASYTDNGVGDVTINFTNAFSGARAYTASFHAMVSLAAGGNCVGPLTTAPATTAFRMGTTTFAGALNDVIYAFAQFHGDQ